MKRFCEQDTISQVRFLGSSVSSLLSDIKTSGAENFASTSGKLSALQQSLSDAEKSTKEYHGSLTKTISLLQKESGGEHKEIVLALMMHGRKLPVCWKRDFQDWNHSWIRNMAD